MKKVIIYLQIIALLLLMLSCSDFLKEYSQDLVVPKTPTDLDEVLVGSIDGYLPSFEILSAESGIGISGRWFNVLDDDVNTVIAKAATNNWMSMAVFYFGYTTWQLEVGRNLKGDHVRDDEQLWADLYHRINSMNVMLKQLEEVKIENERERLKATRIKGECLFLRAHFYFVLANIYGKAYSPLTAEKDLAVPLKLTEYVVYDKDAEVTFERATVKVIYDQIIKDLQLSLEALTESPQGKPKYRASKEAVLLLLSRVYLYMQDWGNAKHTAEEFLKYKNNLLNLNQFGEDNFVVTTESPEFVFTQGSLCMQQGYSGYGGDFCVSSNLYNLFADNDARKAIFFSKNLQTDSVAVARKFNYKVHRSPISDVFSLRTAEGYLNAAEACAMLNEDNTALKYLNFLRKHRYTDGEEIALSGSELVEEIRNERRRELCFEGHRWFDLRRYAADIKYPLKKEIIRTFAIYDYDMRNRFLSARLYKLEIDDPAYVFQIPRQLLQLEPNQIPNEREDRDFDRFVFKSDENEENNENNQND